MQNYAVDLFLPCKKNHKTLHNCFIHINYEAADYNILVTSEVMARQNKSYARTILGRMIEDRDMEN